MKLVESRVDFSMKNNPCSLAKFMPSSSLTTIMLPKSYLFPYADIPQGYRRSHNKNIVLKEKPTDFRWNVSTNKILLNM